VLTCRSDSLAVGTPADTPRFTAMPLQHSPSDGVTLPINPDRPVPARRCEMAVVGVPTHPVPPSLFDYHVFGGRCCQVPYFDFSIGAPRHKPAGISVPADALDRPGMPFES